MLKISRKEENQVCHQESFNQMMNLVTHGFRVVASLPLTQNVPTIPHNTTRFC